MLNKMKIALASAVAIAAISSTGAQAATATGTATVEIVTPVKLSAVTSLNLGLVAASATTGTVTVATSANTQNCSGVVCLGGSSRGSFQVTAASAGAVIDLSISAPSIVLSDGPGGGADMPLNLTLSNASIVFNAASLQTVYVGGTLNVGAAQVNNTYTGTFQVVADYQ
jgi:Mat/Ecp fimbriae major subunit